MRFSIFLIALALLPMMMIAHGWLYTEKQEPTLQAKALEVLKKNGIRSAVADLRYLDLRIAGNAADGAMLDSTRQAVLDLGPLRLVKDDLSIPATLHARQEQGVLELSGWLPEETSVQRITQLIAKLRPDLQVNTAAVKVHPRVSWPEGEAAPLTAESSLLTPIMEKLRVAPWLDIQRDTQGLQAAGVLPANGLRAAVVSVLKTAQTDKLVESTHTLPVEFAHEETLIPFLKRFFADDSPRRLAINDREGPLIEAPATRGLESEWLALLRPVTGGKRVEMRLTLYPSEYHFPGRKIQSPLPMEVISNLTATLKDALIIFSRGSTALSATEQARLAALTPALLSAGPALRLVIGGHPDPEGDLDTEKRLARARAEQVLSFLVEQGLPTSDVETLAFDPVPSNSPGAPLQTQSVEILLR